MNLIFLKICGSVSGNVFIYYECEIIALYREYSGGRFTSGTSMRPFPVRSVGMSAGSP